jgi:hypothetical protein
MGFIVRSLKQNKKKCLGKRYAVVRRQRMKKAPSYIDTKGTAVLIIWARRLCFGFCFRHETKYEVERLIVCSVMYHQLNSTYIVDCRVALLYRFKTWNVISKCFRLNFWYQYFVFLTVRCVIFGKFKLHFVSSQGTLIPKKCITISLRYLVKVAGIAELV